MSETLGINNNKILPVQNYKTQVECDINMDILTLRALRQILRFSKDFLRDKTQHLPRLVKPVKEEVSTDPIPKIKPRTSNKKRGKLHN